MFRQSNRSRYSREVEELQKRLQYLERRFDRIGSAAARTASNGLTTAAHATDRVGEAVVAALGDLVDRFRGGARSMSGEAARFGQEAARLGYDAQRIGGEALQRASAEIIRRPLMMVAIAAGVGILIGMSGRRN